MISRLLTEAGRAGSERAQDSSSAAAAARESQRGCQLRLPLHPGHVAGLVGVPLGLAVVAEAVAASGAIAGDAGAGGAAGGDHGVRAVGARAPAGVGVTGQDATEHEKLVEL
jgi:hypothetical protein